MPKQSPTSITERLTALAIQRRWLLPTNLLLAAALAGTSYLLLQPALASAGLGLLAVIVCALLLYLLVLLLINLDTTLDLRATARKLARSNRHAVIEEPLYTEQISTILLPPPGDDQTAPDSGASVK